MSTAGTVATITASELTTTVRHVLDATDAEVTTLDALTYAGDRSNLDGVDADRHQFVEGDITDREFVDDLVAEADAVVNFAAESHVDRSWRTCPSRRCPTART